MCKLYILPLLFFLSSISSIAQTEDTLVVELLYKADHPTTDDKIYIDRATIYHYGEVVVSSEPLDHFENLEYNIRDTFGTMGKRGSFAFNREMLPDLNNKIPVQVSLNGQYRPGFIKIATQKALRFNFYTDTIKPVLNFWINVEGIKKDSTILPLSADELILSTSYGEIKGLELILPSETMVEYITLKACLIERPTECVEQTLPIMKKDAMGRWADDPDYNPDVDENGVLKEENPNVPGYKKKTYYIEDEEEENPDSMEEELEYEEEIKYEDSDSKWDYLFKKVFRKKKTD